MIDLINDDDNDDNHNNDNNILVHINCVKAVY